MAVSLLSAPTSAKTLPGSDYATWGIWSSDAAIPDGKVITNAVLTLSGVSPSNATIDVYLLDNPRPGYFEKQKFGVGGVFAGYGAKLTGTMQNGNLVCRLGQNENNNLQSFVWESFTYPFNFLLADGRTVSYTSALLEMIDYVGTGGSFGIGIESIGNSSISFSSLELKLTVSSYLSSSADQILTFTYSPDTSVAQPASALQFDGVDDTVTWSYLTTPVNNFTVSAWVKTEQLHEIDVESTSGAAGLSGQKYLFRPEYGVGMGISVGTNGISVYEHDASYVPALAVYQGNLGTDWNHIVVTYTNKQPRIYLNGVLVRTGLVSPKATVSAPRQLGGRNWGFFKGEVSGVRIWSRSLNAAEALASMSGDLGGTGLAGDWKINEGTGATINDYSGNGRHGTINGAAWISLATVTKSKTRAGLQFDGVDDTVTWSYLTTPVNNFTVSAWVKTEQLHEIDVESTSGAAGLSGQKYLFRPEYGVGMGISVGTNGISVYEHDASYVPALAVYQGNLGTDWNHIVVTYTNKQPRIYLNGVLVRTGLVSPKATVSAPRQLGGRNWGFFKGEVSGVRIWSRSLNAAEVLSSMSGDLGSTGLAGDWKINEGAGATINDYSGNGRHGTINGAAWSTAR